MVFTGDIGGLRVLLPEGVYIHGYLYIEFCYDLLYNY